MRREIAIGLVAISLRAAIARADEPPAEKICLAPPRRALAATAAIVPGLVVPGAGHFVAGDPATARKLLAAGGIGLGGAAVVATSIFLTGASRHVIAPLTVLAIGSVGLYLSSVFADLYGVLSPPGGTGRAARSAPTLQAEVGYRYVYDPVFSYRSFLAARLEARSGRWFASPSIWTAVDGVNARARLAAGARFGGAASYLELEGAFTLHRWGDEEFTTMLGELAVSGRLDLARVDRSLSGAFVELGTGYARGGVSYDDVDAGAEGTDLLLGRIAFGLYLGHGAGAHGELALTYDHRHDDFAAGLKLPGVISGPVGHFGLHALYVWRGGLGVLVETEAGSAWVVGASLVVRKGGTR